MWFQVEYSALHDERVKLLAKRLGVSFNDAFVALCHVWAWLYKQGGGPMVAEEVDVVGGYSGLGEGMESVGLAEATPEGLRIRGDKRAKAYGAFRLRQHDRAQARQDRLHDLEKTNVVEETIGVPTALPSAVPKSASNDLSDLSGDLFPESGSGKTTVRTKAQLARDAAASWMEWFNRHFTRRLTVTQALVKQVGALLAQGYTDKPDMRGVALYLENLWEGDAKMAQYLVPASILRVTKFEERLDLAKEWAPEVWKPKPASTIASGEEAVQAQAPPAPPKEFVAPGEVRDFALSLAKHLKRGMT